MSAISIPDRSVSSNGGDHTPLISALSTFYNLIADQGSISRSAIIMPPTNAPYPEERINVAAAEESGFGDEALTVLYRIPYLDESADDVVLNYETTTLRYVDDDEFGTAFDFARDPTYQERTDLMPPYVVVLTQGRTGGVELIYNTRTRRITGWDHFEDEEEWPELPSYSMDDVENPLYQWIINFMTLLEFHLAPTQLVRPDPTGAWPDPDHPPDPNLRGEDRLEWGRLARSTRHEWTLKDVFVAAGWDVDNAVRIIEDRTAGSVWERLERARLVAANAFDKGEFERRKVQWERAAP